MSEHEQVVREGDIEWSETDEGDDHEFRRKKLGAAASAEDLGVSRYSVPAGKRLWHRHFHTANEEGLYVLDGSGTIALGPDQEEIDLSPGTYVTLPPDERGDHAIRAGDDGLELLMVSTMDEPDVLVYPEEDMVGLYVGSPPGGDEDERLISSFVDLDEEREYWE